MKENSIPNYILQGYKRIKVPGQRIYMCNKEGVVINAKTGRKLKPVLSRDGYFVLVLNAHGFSIHRIIATLFVDKSNPRFNIVKHKNKIKTDNRAENLEWCYYKRLQQYVPNYILQGYKRIKMPGQRIYMCNKEGVVINAKTGGKIKPFLSNSGYYFVILNGKSFFIHRIVATLFVEKANPRFNTVNHKNEIKTDNRAENLEWCSVMYNVNYKGANKRNKENCFQNIVVKAIKDNETTIYDSIAAASRATGVGINTIRYCISGVQKRTRSGYSFQFVKRAINPFYIKKKIKAEKDGEVFIYESTLEASNATGMCRMAIWQVAHGKRKHAKGWVFSYV